MRCAGAARSGLSMLVGPLNPNSVPHQEGLQATNGRHMRRRTEGITVSGGRASSSK